MVNSSSIVDPSLFPVLTTERLTLREPLLSDAADYLIVGSDYEVQKYNMPVMNEVQEAEALIEEVRTEYACKEGISWAVTITGSDKMLGLFGFYHWSHHHRRAEVGYALARAYWGQGIGTEAVRAMIVFGFEQMNLHRIYAGTIADNHESVRMLEKIGLERYVNEFAKNLPYGAQRRLEIARALATEPFLLLLDEPAAGMNAQETKELDDLIIRLRSEMGVSILLIEHDMKLVMSLSDRIYVVDYGKKIAEGNPEEIKSNPAVIKAYLGEDIDA